MVTSLEAFFLATCLFEGFFYGLYSGIFIMYLRCPMNKSRTTIILFYSICILYVLSLATLICDLVFLILSCRIRALPLELQIQAQYMLFRLNIIQTTAIGCCDILSQCIMIYRCWIVWGQKKRVVIVPLFLVFAFTVTWFASDASVTFDSQAGFQNAAWGLPVIVTSFAASMAVNTLVTGLIVYKILVVFLEVKSLTGDRTWSSLSSVGGGAKLRHVLFVIIESGMVLFITQAIRMVLINVVFRDTQVAINFISPINQMLHGITPTIILVRVSMNLSFDDNESFKKTSEGLFKAVVPISDPDTLQPQMENISGMSPVESNDSQTTC